MIGDEDDLEALCSQERFEDVAHDVDGRLLVRLDLLPDDRILEHAELDAVELTGRLHRPSGVHHDHVTPRQHPQLLGSCTSHTVGKTSPR